MVCCWLKDAVSCDTAVAATSWGVQAVEPMSLLNGSIAAKHHQYRITSCNLS